MEPEELTIREFAQQLDMSPSGVKNWIARGKVESRLVMIKNRYTRLIPASELDRIKKEQGNIAPPPTPTQSREINSDSPEQTIPTHETAMIPANLMSLIQKSLESDLKIRSIEDKLDMLRLQNEELIEKIIGRGKHWEPWREIVHLSGVVLLRTVKRFARA